MRIRKAWLQKVRWFVFVYVCVFHCLEIRYRNKLKIHLWQEK